MLDGRSTLGEDGQVVEGQNISLDEILFGSQITFSPETRRFTGSVSLENLHQRPGQPAEALSGDERFVIADYVGLAGKRLQISTQGGIGATMARLARQVKVCLTNPQSPRPVLDFLQQGLSSSAPGDFGDFFRLKEGEMLLWVHFPASGQAELEFWFESSTLPQVADFLRRERLKLVSRGFAEAMQAVKAVSDLLSAAIKSAQIPEVYWNAAHPEYVSTMKIVLALLYTDLTALDDLASDQLNLSQLQFALLAGAWEGALDELAGIPELVSLLSGYLADEDVRQAIREGISAVSFQKIGKEILKSAGKQIETFGQLDCASAHLLGKDMALVASFFVGLGEVKTATSSGKFMKTLGELAAKNADNSLQLALRLKKLPASIRNLVKIEGNQLRYKTQEIGEIQGDRILTQEALFADAPPAEFQRMRTTGEAPELLVRLEDGSELQACLFRADEENVRWTDTQGRKCFPAGTLIWTVQSLTPIEQIKIGDLVWAWNHQEQSYELKPVAQTFIRQTSQLINVYTKGQSLCQSTPEHPFWSVSEKKYVEAQHLKRGDKLLGLTPETTASIQALPYLPHYEVEVDSLGWIDSTLTVYNFEVEGLHNYLVGAEGILVHNASYDFKNYNHKGIKYFQKYENVVLKEMYDDNNFIIRGSQKQAFEIIGEPDRIMIKMREDQDFEYSEMIENIDNQVKDISLLKEKGIPVVEIFGVTQHKGIPAMIQKKYDYDYNPFNNLDDNIIKLFTKETAKTLEKIKDELFKK
ncbi:MAG: hypothetical protein HC880_00555 [Bacteroidia bacterium]|nr:hypothetical protein [Bacteroidia bacterium]